VGCKSLLTHFYKIGCSSDFDERSDDNCEVTRELWAGVTGGCNRSSSLDQADLLQGAISSVCMQVVSVTVGIC
jgi:hypothetical protein